MIKFEWKKNRWLVILLSQMVHFGGLFASPFFKYAKFHKIAFKNNSMKVEIFVM
jgi:hypothetical protein